VLGVDYAYCIIVFKHSPPSSLISLFAIAPSWCFVSVQLALCAHGFVPSLLNPEEQSPWSGEEGIHPYEGSF
jgi:hypothetical protein